MTGRYTGRASISWTFRYAGFEATTKFELVDAGNIVVSNRIKQVGFLWVSGEISDWGLP